MADLIPSVVFESDKSDFHRQLIHGVRKTDEVVSRNVTLVTALCGRVGIGRVKTRRALTCGECRSAGAIA